MGGCVSSPKEVALNDGEVAPVVETPTTPKNAEGQTVVARENTQEEGDNKEEPLVELTEAKDEKVEEAKAEEAEVVVTAETNEPEKEEVKAEQLKEAKEKSEEPLLTL